MTFQIKRVYEPTSPTALRKLGKSKRVTLLYAAHA